MESTTGAVARLNLTSLSSRRELRVFRSAGRGVSGIDVVQAKAAKRENLLDNTKLLMKKYWPRYLPLLSVGSTLVLEATRLVLTTDSAASPLLSGVRLKEADRKSVV